MTSGTTNQQELNVSTVRTLQVPVPPLGEQQRIVVKVEELMERCRALDAGRRMRSDIATSLRASSLNALVSADSVDRLREAWNSIHDRWDELIGFKEAVDEIRLTILQLAVTGMLATQSPEDEHSRESVARSRQSLAGLPPVRGRKASTARISGNGALSVGRVDRKNLKPGWVETPLSNVTRIESGHTPDRSVPDYWIGSIPWMGIQDARRHQDGVITDTDSHISQAGVDNSATRLLPAGTVCLSRTASVGYVVVLGREMCTSQDFVNFVCAEAIDPAYLQLIFRAERPALSRFAKRAVHSTIYFPEVKALHVLLPPLNEQRRITARVDELLKLCDDLEAAVVSLEGLGKALGESAIEHLIDDSWGPNRQASYNERRLDLP